MILCLDTALVMKGSTAKIVTSLVRVLCSAKTVGTRVSVHAKTARVAIIRLENVFVELDSMAHSVSGNVRLDFMVRVVLRSVNAPTDCAATPSRATALRNVLLDILENPVIKFVHLVPMATTAVSVAVVSNQTNRKHVTMSPAPVHVFLDLLE